MATILTNLAFLSMRKRFFLILETGQLNTVQSTWSRLTLATLTLEDGKVQLISTKYFRRCCFSIL